LDHTLMEWAAKISEAQKMLGNQTKGLLKKAVEPYLPKEVIYRPKMGFGVPIEHWLRGPLRDWAECLLSKQRLQQEGYFKPDKIRNTGRTVRYKIIDQNIFD